MGMNKVTQTILRDKVNCVIIYVEDTYEIVNLRINLFKKFEMKDLEAHKYFLEKMIEIKEKYGKY